MVDDAREQQAPAPLPEIRFTLIANARDSLEHAVFHLTGAEGGSPANLKIAIREVAQVVELLLKERLQRVHPAFAWENVDKYPSREANTIGTGKAVERLASICGIRLSPEAMDSIKACRRLRNEIEHFEFVLKDMEARGIIGRLLSLIFDFSKRHLGLDLEAEFRRDHRWKALVDLYEFREVHGAAVAEGLKEAKRATMGCPSCGAETFDIEEERCALCGHEEELFQCESCTNHFRESEVSSLPLEEGGDVLLCHGCEGRDTGDYEPEDDYPQNY